MAVRWRIRRKLQLGLGVVVALIALILGGTLQGLGAFTATVKTADSKLAEIHAAQELRLAVAALRTPPAGGAELRDEDLRLRKLLKGVRTALDGYEVQLNNTIDRGRDSDSGGHERALVGDLRGKLDTLQRALDDARSPQLFRPGDDAQLASDEGVRDAVKKLEACTNQLCVELYDELWKRIDVAKHEHLRSVYVVSGTSAAGVLTLVVMLRVFYKWVFHPIRDLQAGVERVAQGDFTQPIVVESRDELHELATAFNAMSDKLRKAYADLLNQVNERGKQLVRSERLASVGFLAAGVAHEINNPLASIAFCAEGLERRLGDLLGRFPREHEAIGKYLKMIQQEAFRCKSITQGLLEFSRVGEGNRVPTNLAEIVQAVLNMVQHLPKAQGKRIVFRPAGRAVAEVNPQEVQQVVLNIISNALDSMDEGGTLTIELAQRGQAAELAFRDTGCGMDREVLDNIFQPFFTRSRTGKGTGLGLSISHKIVSQHGGEIEASSPGPGQGTTFVVRLPTTSAPAKEVSVGHAAAA